ncbi:MAG: hypothetical protein FJ295_08715 [Planctomycetes bacterium]|nr:hypothetical protein [Planctomycetota bacterium]
MITRRVFCLATLCGAAVGRNGAAEQSPLPEGTGQVAVSVQDRPIELFTYKPPGFRSGPLIMVFHGVLRNADEYRDHARGMGDRHQALIVAPRFTEADFPLEKYQLGGLRVNGSIRPSSEWTWQWVAPIADAIRRRESRPEMPLFLIGHSGGGQFLVRLAGFVSTGAKRVVAANAGTLLFPSREYAFPYGFGELPDELSNDDALRRYLAQPLTFYLGSGDIERDEYLDVKPAADRQGMTRFERGRNAFALGQRLAEERGWEFGWRLVIAEGVEHDHEKMFDHPQCQKALFDTP